MPRQAGFTLVEVAVALAILALVLVSFLGTRTEALVDATEARNWRLAKELAEELLSELQAGAREIPPDVGRQPVQRYEGFEYQIVIGENQIAEFEAYESTDWEITSSNSERSNRRAWQRERDDLRAARQKGLTLPEYRERQLQEEYSEESEQRAPSETDFEEVLVAVYFPRAHLNAEEPEASFRLKARVSTLAIEGLTPEEASALASATGLEQPEPAPGDEGGTSQ